MRAHIFLIGMLLLRTSFDVCALDIRTIPEVLKKCGRYIFQTEQYKGKTKKRVRKGMRLVAGVTGLLFIWRFYRYVQRGKWCQGNVIVGQEEDSQVGAPDPVEVEVQKLKRRDAHRNVQDDEEDESGLDNLQDHCEQRGKNRNRGRIPEDWMRRAQ